MVNAKQPSVGRATLAEVNLDAPFDTTEDALAVHRAVLRQLGPNRRLEMAMQMSNMVRKLVEAGVRHRHPDYDDATVRMAVLLILQGEEVFQQCFPGREVQR